MKIRTMIVDDEPHAIEVIESYLESFTDIEVVAKCGDGIQAFHTLQQKKIDLMFLDVKMPGLNGTDLLKSLKNPPKTIFTTAYHDYAVEGFDLNAVDYLLKPVSFDRFLKAIDKAYDVLGLSSHRIAVSETDQTQNKNIFLYLKVDRKMVKIDVREILWIESLKDYIKVILKDRTYISKQKISVIGELLPEDVFLRIHRSFVVSMPMITSFTSQTIEIGGHELPVGRNYRNDCQRRLKAL